MTPLSDWIAYVFDHPVLNPCWRWSSEAPLWEVPPEQTVALVAETFERSGEWLAGYTDAQLNQCFWYLLYADLAGPLAALGKPEVPLAARRRAVRSFVPLFEQVMAARCSPHLSHLDEGPANPLNAASRHPSRRLPRERAAWRRRVASLLSTGREHR